MSKGVKWKLTMNREKDKIDIELIKNILAKNTKRIKVSKKRNKIFYNFYSI